MNGGNVDEKEKKRRGSRTVYFAIGARWRHPGVGMPLVYPAWVVERCWMASAALLGGDQRY